VTNVDTHYAADYARLERLDDEKRANAEDTKEFYFEMKKKGRTTAEIDGMKLHAKRRHWDAGKFARLKAAEEKADELAASGTAPLFEAAQ